MKRRAAFVDLEQTASGRDRIVKKIRCSYSKQPVASTLGFNQTQDSFPEVIVTTRGKAEPTYWSGDLEGSNECDGLHSKLKRSTTSNVSFFSVYTMPVSIAFIWMVDTREVHT